MVGSLAYSSLLFCCLYSLALYARDVSEHIKPNVAKFSFSYKHFHGCCIVHINEVVMVFVFPEGWSGEDACPCSRQVDDPARISKAQCRWEACCRGAEKEPCGSKDSRTGRAHQENGPSATFFWLLELVLIGSNLAPLLPLPLWSISPVTVY